MWAAWLAAAGGWLEVGDDRWGCGSHLSERGRERGPEWEGRWTLSERGRGSELGRPERRRFLAQSKGEGF
ncbi:hypothetical protein [Oryza sativa Japonica Group]|uniref:Uncharacterized protein n=1 Tax=Oryza sativa subsp. japonica TaxID=39947 RepID=Q5NAB9_ORYSJ|nr:hypothetical protein [Oryza sativa Japonica Group]BAD81587.1 hypothetical protein [Oryza sativa Japonica Group]